MTIDPNERDPVRGTMFAEQALSALQKHATQGPWPNSFAEFTARFRAFTDRRGAAGQMPLIRYALVKSANGAAQVPNRESHNFLDGLRLPDQVASESAVPALNGSLLELSANREQAMAQLIEGLKRSSYGHAVARPVDPLRRDIMMARAQQALALAGGIHLEISPSATRAIPGSILNLSVKSNSASGSAIRNCNSWLVSRPGRVSSNGKLQIPPDVPVNLPVSQHLYEPTALGQVVNTRCTVEISGVTHFYLDQATDIDIAPPIQIEAPQIFVATGQSAARQFIVSATNNEPESFSGRIVPYVKPPCDSIACKEAAFEDTRRLQPLMTKSVTLRPGETVRIQISIPLPSMMNRQNGSLSGNAYYEVMFKALAGSSGKELKEVAGESSPVVFAYSSARTAANLNVGYIRGFDFSLPNALNALGVESKELSVDEVKTADLSKYTSVIVDNRVYESKPQLIAANQKLLDYANAGGNLIVFYHKSDEWNPDERRNRPQLAPYKLILGNERITDENAPITFIEADHPLFE